MLGMGKAMDGWLTALDAGGEDADAAREGLGNLKDSLLNAASADTSTIVHQWGWSEVLETPPSRTSTPVKAQSGYQEVSSAPQSSVSRTGTPVATTKPSDTFVRPTRTTSPPTGKAELGRLDVAARGPRNASSGRDLDSGSSTPIKLPVDTPFDPLAGVGVSSSLGVHRTGSGRARPGPQMARSTTQAPASVDPLLGLDV